MIPADFPAGGYTADYLGFWAIWIALAAAAVAYLRRSRRRGAKPARGRLVLGNALVGLALLWTAVLAGETYLRYVHDETDAFSMTLTTRSWHARHLRLNSLGFREREFGDAKRPGVVRVGCLGDSFTMAQGVPDAADAWPQRIGAALEAREPGRYEVLNLGISGVTTGMQIGVLQHFLPRAGFDRIVLGYCLNDTDDLLPPDRWFDADDEPRAPWIGPTTSFVADFLWFRLVNSRHPKVVAYFDSQKEAYADPRIFAQQEARFREMAALCRAAGVRLDVAVFPCYPALDHDPYDFAEAHDRTIRAFRALGVETVDLRACYAGIPARELVCNRFDSHPNARAHAIAADEILARLFPAR